MSRRQHEYIKLASAPVARIARPQSQAQVLVDAKPDRARDLTIFMVGMVVGILEMAAVLGFFG